MERAVGVAWKMFWVGLGASAVLIAQTLVTRAPDPTPRVELPTPATTMPAAAALPRI
ncbi:MAG TPA: hypothetical protein VIF62_18820 [Labilithrix sp.]